jgi:hypothetical protein
MGDREISETSHAQSAAVAEVADGVRTLLKAANRETAMRFAMEASGALLRTPTDDLRIDLRMTVFKQFSRLGDSYQANDFESVDYALYDLRPDLPLLRGPRVSAEALAAGDYFCVLGAAQTFGRLAREPWAKLLSEAIDLPVLNLARGGVGPDFYLDPQLVDYARGARFVVLQVMSGRSVGCDEYPGGRHITREGQGTPVHRWDVLEGMWREDPAIALRYVHRWNATYLDLYGQLRAAIDRPILLLWISDREPDAWRPKMILKKLKWGSFPQLVGADLYADVAALFEERLEMVTGHSRVQPTSRITGEPCPYFGSGKKFHTEFDYYPSSSAHAQLAATLTPWARALLGQSGGRSAADDAAIVG